MDSIRRELEARQTQHQQQIQVRIYDAMIQIISATTRSKTGPIPPRSEQALVMKAFSRQHGGRTSEAASFENISNKTASEDNREMAARGYSINRGGQYSNILISRHGYSMASDIMVKNKFVPTSMLGAFAHLSGAPKGSETD